MFTANRNYLESLQTTPANIHIEAHTDDTYRIRIVMGGYMHQSHCFFNSYKLLCI